MQSRHPKITINGEHNATRESHRTHTCDHPFLCKNNLLKNLKLGTNLNGRRRINFIQAGDNSEIYDFCLLNKANSTQMSSRAGFVRDVNPVFYKCSLIDISFHFFSIVDWLGVCTIGPCHLKSRRKSSSTDRSNVSSMLYGKGSRLRLPGGFLSNRSVVCLLYAIASRRTGQR